MMGDGNTSTVTAGDATSGAAIGTTLVLGAAGACALLANSVARNAIDLAATLTEDEGAAPGRDEATMAAKVLRARLLYLLAELDTCKALAVEARSC